MASFRRVSTDLAIPLMSAPEARSRCDRIRSHLDAAWRESAALYEGRAWEALGYASWAELCEEEFSVRRSHAYRWIGASRARAELSPLLGTDVVDGISLRQASVYAECKTEEQKSAYCDAVRQAGGFGEITGTTLAAVTDELAPDGEFEEVTAEPVLDCCPTCGAPIGQPDDAA